ncbi:hypothetical protein AK812_SmicGene349 [Symbiodinium microadriaticum]|uniref:Uncharacterized protein n=1 Tax=Symbiodinium microadriaticum TaxID=2951 RepID=A0A1Q9F6Y6_SYMMI|nr:hypothetical protein AK812_SmicGene349 [Symbiodinium microadriaticum]
MTSRTGNPYLDFMLQNAVLFPWGSDDEEEEEAAFHRSRSPRKEFSGSRDRLVLEVDNASRITWKLPNHVALAGRILEHCQAVIHRVRLETGGLELAIYKMGITHDCCARFELYRAKGWDQMVVMHECPDLGSVEMLEATAKHVVSIAQTFAGDDSSKALQTMARCCKNDAEKALQKVLREFDLTLDVPITQMACAAGVNIPVLLPQVDPGFRSSGSATGCYTLITTYGCILTCKKILWCLFCFTVTVAARFVRLDILHVYHLGMGRDFTASSLVVLLDVYEAGSVAQGLELMTADLRRFLSQTRRQLHFKVLSRDLLGYKTDNTFPSGHWSKGADTPVVMEFLLWLLRQHQSKVDGDQLLRVIFGAADAMGVFMRTVLAGGLWLTSAEATTLYDSGMHFLQSYGKCASIAFRRNLCRYNLTPKLHCWHHLCYDLKRSLDRGLQYHLSPLADANFADEDFVGRVSRLSRRVSPRLQALRTIGRYLAATRAQLTVGQGD